MVSKGLKNKILFVDHGGGTGGGAMFLYYLLKFLNREKFQPFVAFYFYNDGSETARIKSLGVPIFFLSDKNVDYFPIKRLLGKSEIWFFHNLMVICRFLIQMAIVEVPITWRLTRLLKKEDISLIVLNCDVHYHLAGAFSSKIAGIPCICRKAGGIGEGKKIKKVLTPFVDLFIAVSKATARDQIRNNPRTRRLVITYEGVDSKMFNNKMDPCEKKKELGISTDKKIICSISRFDGGKGQLELLEAASLIIKKYQDVIFLLVGDGELMDDLRRKTQRLNLNHYVVFTGWRKDVPEVLSIIDIFVHCPTTCIEALGIANLEAMAMGKPCVVSDNGGLPDAVLEGVTGFVVPVGNIERMAEAILTLLQNEELMKNFGENARKRVEEEFDIRKNIKKLEMYFEEYCDRRKPRGKVLKCQ